MRSTLITLILLGLAGAALLLLPDASASAVPDTTPALAATGPDELTVIWGDTVQTSTGGRWSEPAALAGTGTTGAGLAADPATGRTLTARVADGSLWVRTGTDEWSSIGASVLGSPAVVALGGDDFAVVVRDEGSAAKIRYLRDEGWGPWKSLGGTLTASPAAVARGTGIVVAAPGRDRKVRTAVVTRGETAGWRRTGVIATASPGLTADPGDGTLHLITRGLDLAATARTSTNARTWSAPTRLDGRLGSGIAAAARAPGAVDIAALTLDGRPVQNSYAHGRWQGFRPISATAVAPHTTVLADDAVTSVTGDPAGTRTLHLAPGVPIPAPGDILAATSTPATPDGLLVKVTAVTGSTVTAVPATLTEAIPQGTIHQSFALGAPGPIVQEINEQVTCTNGAEVALTGSVSSKPDFTFDAAWGETPSASFTGSLAQETRLSVSMPGRWPCRLRRTGLEADVIRFQPITFAVGPVPVVITPELRLRLDVAGTMPSALTMSAGQTASAQAGLTYRDGVQTPSSGGDSTFSSSPPTGSGTAEAGANPEFTFLIYGVPGPRLGARSHVRLEAGALQAGISAGVELRVPQLGVDQRKYDIIRYRRTLIP
jgi:hypothetical protein